jgi:hypothetical protein
MVPLAARFMVVSCLAHSSTLKMEATSCSSETSVDFKRTTWRYISEDMTLHDHLCENLKLYKVDKSLHRGGRGVFKMTTPASKGL